MSDLDLLIGELSHRGVAWEALTLLACLAAAYGICWLTGRRQPPESVLFGRVLFDGLLFPVLALAFTYTARVALGGLQEVPLLRLAVPVLVSLAGIRLLARVFTMVFPASRAAKLVERIFSWLAWLVAALWILGLLPAAREETEAIKINFGASSSISLLDIVRGVLSSGLVLVLVLWVSATLERKVLRDNIADLSLRKAAANATRAVLLVLGLLVALSAVGVDLTALSVLGGAVGVGLGFGLQKLAANYVSGFVILSERSLRIGDLVRVDGFEGVVADIKTRYTLIRAGNGRASIVPNEKLISERVENLSLTDPRVLLVTDIAVGYDSDVALVMKLLEDAAMRVQRVLADPAPAAKLARFGADGLEFQLLYWIDDPQNGQLNVRSDVNVRALQALREADIDIPFPQRVVHLRTGSAAAAAGPIASGTEETG
jgi:small-conductance mechanosensitive channel